ncbi:MAG: hypothetical protein DMG07_12650 [Acidobacteria bacterium]|nr:MAG: hypothetical protein DMG07_12650 [Acidobacteriota bacterium]
MIFYGPTSSVISIGALSRSFPHAIRSVTFFGLSLGYIHASKSHNRHEADLPLRLRRRLAVTCHGRPASSF